MVERLPSARRKRRASYGCYLGRRRVPAAGKSAREYGIRPHWRKKTVLQNRFAYVFMPASFFLSSCSRNAEMIPKKAYKIGMNYFFQELLMNEKQGGVHVVCEKAPPSAVAQRAGLERLSSWFMSLRGPLKLHGPVAVMRRCHFPHLHGGSWPSRSRAFRRRPRACRD